MPNNLETLNQAEIENYINRLPYNAAFTGLDEDMRSKVAFGAWETLRRRYGAAVVTNELAALQALFMAEGEEQEFAMFKRQDVGSMGLDGMSISFKGNSTISPEVIAMIEQQQNDAGSGALFGRLV